MTSPMWQKSDELPVFFPQPIFAEPSRPAAAINMPILAELPPEEEIFVLSWDDIVSSEEEAAEFRARIADYVPPVKIPEEHHERFRYGCDRFLEAYKIIGREGVLGMLHYLDFFDQRMSVMNSADHVRERV